MKLDRFKNNNNKNNNCDWKNRDMLTHEIVYVYFYEAKKKQQN